MINASKISSADCRRDYARRRLRSTDSTMLQAPPTRRSTIGDRAFPVAAVCHQDWSRQLTAAVSARNKSTPVPSIVLRLIGSCCCASQSAGKFLTSRRSSHVFI